MCPDLPSWTAALAPTLDSSGNLQDAFTGGTSLFRLRDGADRVRRHVYDGAYGDIYVPEGIPVVAIGSDDSSSQDNTVVWPQITANNLPWTFNCIAGGPTVPSGVDAGSGIGAAGRLTWAQLQTMRDFGGCEIACHSRSHLDPTTQGGLPNFVDEAFAAAETLAAGGTSGARFNVDLFCQPGTWTGNYNLNDTSLVDPALAAADGPLGGLPLGGQIGQWLRARYAGATAYVLDDLLSPGGAINGIIRLPITSPYGIARALDWTTVSLANVQATVQYARGVQSALLAMFGHTFNLGTGGPNNTVATFNSIVQYLAAQRDAGNIVLLTMSAALRAKPWPSGRKNLLLDGDFHLDTPGTVGAGGALVGWKLAAGAPTIIASGAQVGALPPSGGASLIINTSADQVFFYLPSRQLRQVWIEFYARTANGAASTGQQQRIIWRGLDASSAQVQNVDNRGAGGTGPSWPALTTAWTRYVMMAGVDPQAVNHILWPYVGGGTTGVEYAGFKVYKQ